MICVAGAVPEAPPGTKVAEVEIGPTPATFVAVSDAR
ncbi:unannotated protein [freshwater metagenome]|uniref:Unannotated protein n=1 Tax=freshwater metagenome TaxID=449393 RepID=A0A6J7BD27_9ZZZZ